MSVLIDLRFSNVDPPESEPERTIYTDLVNIPDPVKLGLTVRVFNHDDVDLYMRVDGLSDGWTFTTNNLGLLGSGLSMYHNLDEFGTRSKPVSATSETITVRLRAYTDSGYTDLKWTFERVIDVVFIKSDDGSWTLDFLNNFDDGTVQGWACANEVGNRTSGITYPILEVATDFVLSPAYSLRMRQMNESLWTQVRARLYKTFDTPNRNNVFAIIDFRAGEANPANMHVKYLNFKNADVLLVYIGKPADTVAQDYYPTNKWMRLVIPLPKNTSVEVRIVDDLYYGNAQADKYLWLDDFRIISKD